MIQEMPTKMLFREECTIEGERFLNFMKKKTKRQSFRRESGPQGPNHPRSKLLNNAKIVTAQRSQGTQHFDKSKRSETQDQIQIQTGNGTGKG